MNTGFSRLAAVARRGRSSCLSGNTTKHLPLIPPHQLPRVRAGIPSRTPCSAAAGFPPGRVTPLGAKRNHFASRRQSITSHTKKRQHYLDSRLLPRDSTQSPGPGVQRADSARLQELQLPPRVLSSQQPPLPPLEEKLLTTRGLRTTTPRRRRAAALPAPFPGRAGALGSVYQPGWRRLDAVSSGICSFSRVTRAVCQRDKNYKSRLPQRCEPGHVAGADRACVPPLIRCCSEEVVLARVVCVCE